MATCPTMDPRYRVLSEAQELASEYEVLSNRVRILILAGVVALGKAKWNEIREIIERYEGRINPNTLSFHLKKLIQAGLIVREGSMESPRYVPNISEDIAKKIEKLVNEIRKELEAGEND